MDFTSLKTRVAEETGLDLTNDATKLGVWVNEAYKFMAGARDWPWMMKSGVLQTTPDITTGTVSINAGATTGTFSSAPASSVALDYFVQFTGQSDDWYPVATHTGASTSFTISNAFVGSSNYTAGAYILRRVYYSLASDVDGILDMREAVNDNPLTYVEARDFDRVLPDPTSTSEAPRVYVPAGLDSSNLIRVHLWPVPSQKVNIHYRYTRKVTELSSGSDSPILPEKFHLGIVFVALAMFGHPYIDDTRMESAERRARAVMEEMMGRPKTHPDKMSVVQPWDQRRGRKPFGQRFPDNFGNTWS